MTPDRYLRHARVEGFRQDALRAMRIAVVGAGAVGNEVVKNLVLLGVGHIDLCDFDRVEIHNLTRSIFLRESDVGASKAAAVAARAREVDPNVCIAALEGDAWRTLSLQKVARYAAVIGCVDNIEARMRLSQLCLLAGTDWINCGIDARFAAVESFPFSAAGLTACYECHLPVSAYQRVAERYSCGWLRRALHAEQTVPTTAITASIAGAAAAQAALRIGADAAIGARRMLFDTRSGASTVTILERHAGCAGCGDYSRRPRRVPAGRNWHTTVREQCPEAAALHLSDPLIFDYECRACGARDDDAYVGRRAADFDDRIMRCGRCGVLAVQIDIRAEATIDELARRFPTMLPIKFALAQRPGEWVCFDVEDVQ